jgi:hypothetical protein
MSDLALWKARVRGWYPRAPGLYVEEIARRLDERDVPPGLEKQSIEDMAAAVVRHQLTDYDDLWSRLELTPEEARAIVEDEVEEWLAQWR